MGEMRDSDWSRQNLLRSDWLLPSVALMTTLSLSLNSETCFPPWTELKKRCYLVIARCAFVPVEGRLCCVPVPQRVANDSDILGRRERFRR